MSAGGSDPLEDEVTALLRGCAAGSHADFQRLYERLGPWLHGVALRITRQAPLAEDVLHDAFLQVWRHAGRFDANSGRALSWIVSIVRYRALDQVRRLGREVAETPDSELEAATPDPLERISAMRGGVALQRCLQELPPERRALVLEAFVLGLTHTELASRRALPLGTVKAWIRRSLIALRRCLAA